MAARPEKRGRDGGRGRSARRFTGSYDDRHLQLIDIAISVFSRRGYVGGTTTEIAKRAGLTQPALYHYVGGKQAFLEQICERVGGRLREGMEEVRSLDAEPLERFATFIRTHASVVHAERDAFRIYVTEGNHLPRKARDKLHEEERAYHDFLVELVGDAITAKQLPPGLDPWLCAQAIMGAMSWIFRWQRNASSAEEFADVVIALLTRPTA